MTRVIIEERAIPRRRRVYASRALGKVDASPVTSLSDHSRHSGMLALSASVKPGAGQMRTRSEGAASS